MDVGVIGTGNMGRNHARIYSEMKDVDSVYIYDLNPKSAEKISADFGAKSSESIQSLLKSVDAVSICVPTKYHFMVAEEAIERGIHCLIEKPISSTSEEGERFLKLIPDHLVVGVGHIERFNPIIGEIKNLMKKPKYIEIRRHNPGSSRITDTGVLIDLMIHDIDLIWNDFFGGKKDSERYSLGDDDLYKMVAKFDDCIVSLSASRISCQKIRTIHVEEEGFTIEGNFMNQELYIYRKPERYGEVNTRYAQENIIEKVLINRVEPLKEELKTFIRCVQREEPFPITPEQAVLNLKIAEGGFKGIEANDLRYAQQVP
jgi:predicted dehydrogenase